MIELQNVAFGYRKKNPLFSDLSLNLERGHVYGLLGSNGVGKTTLLKLVCGLLFPQQGRIEVMGRCPAQRSPSLYRDLFVIPEEFDMPPIRFGTFADTTGALYPAFSRRMLDDYCREFGIDPEIKLNAVSMGQKKKALIAFALACNVRLLVMDEPTNGLDIPAKATFRRLVSSFASEDRTVIISSHQVRDLSMLIDSVVILDTGGVLLNMTVERISEKFCFGSLGDDDDPVYREESLSGYIGVTENRSGRESSVDLELLFNATVRNRDRVRTIVNR